MLNLYFDLSNHNLHIIRISNKSRPIYFFHVWCYFLKTWYTALGSVFKSRHCFVERINSRLKMSTHSYIAIICNGSRGSFCCTLLACQRIKKKHWMISQSIIREARLFAHTSVLMQVKGEETRRKACLLWHITFSPSPSIACWVTESWCLYAAGRG